VKFEVLGQIRDVETIAVGQAIRIYARLVRDFGKGNWRKMKGFALVRLPSGRVLEAEVHWYEAHGVGKRRMKVKRYIDTR
jgi:hypothetical protein